MVKRFCDISKALRKNLQYFACKGSNGKVCSENTGLWLTNTAFSVQLSSSLQKKSHNQNYYSNAMQKKNSTWTWSWLNTGQVKAKCCISISPMPLAYIVCKYVALARGTYKYQGFFI